MTNQTNKVLYTGVTNSLKRRVTEHFEGRGSVFTSKYNCNKLVYFEQFPSIEQAIAREKQLKHFKREWKNQLVETINPQWKDLSHSIIDDPDLSPVGAGHDGTNNGYEYYSYITIISCIYHGKHHVRLLPGPQDRLSALGPHQRRDAGVCVGRHDMCLAL